MNIYDTNGYLDFNALDAVGMPFNFIYGPRGVGKTYGALKKEKTEERKFLFMRREQTEMDMLNKPDFFPFKKLNADLGWHVGLQTLTKYNSAFYDCLRDEKDEWIPSGDPIGYTAALSTIRHLRGFDASDTRDIVYDEFIPETHARPIKGECDALLNAYETVNRNRELQGQPPVKLWCLANSNNLANPIFMGLDLVNECQKMKRNGWNHRVLKDRGILLVDTFDSPISEQKADTALYKLANKKSRFYEMAIQNRFADLDETVSRPKNLKEYKPVVTIGELTVYQHKNDRVFYVTMHRSGSPETFGISEKEITRFMMAYDYLWIAYLDNRIDFEDYMCEALFNKYVK